MFKYNNPLYWLLTKVTKLISSISIGKNKVWTEVEKERIITILKKEPAIILTASNTHLSSKMIKLLSSIVTGTKTTYTHAVMSYYDYKDDTFLLIESTNDGVHLSSVDDILSGADKVCILEIKHESEQELDKINQKLYKQIGKKYDNLFDYVDKSRVSCVEVVLHSIRDRQFPKKYNHLYSMIQKENNLTPQMFRDSLDFKILLEL